jgi:hypothetical protein
MQFIQKTLLEKIILKLNVRSFGNKMLESFMANKLMICLMGMAVYWDHTAIPAKGLPPTSAAMYMAAVYVAALCVMWRAVMPLAEWLVAGPVAASTEGITRLLGFLGTVLEACVVPFAILTAIRAYHDGLDRFVADAAAHPDKAIAVAIGGAVTAFIMTRHGFGVMRASVDGGVLVSAATMTSQVTPAAGVRRTAVHEAGHALFYAALPDGYGTVRVTVIPSTEATGVVNGSVRLDPLQDGIDDITRSYFTWRMLTLLGGFAAETIVFGEASLGSSSDMTKWTASAQLWLSHGYGEVFYANPSANESSQIAHNRLVLNDLKKDHLAIVEEFLSTNRALIEELADQLMEAGHMDSEALRPYFARVTLTNGVPMMDMPVAQ